jgi:membrane protein DedA with SNARE-associated domain
LVERVLDWLASAPPLVVYVVLMVLSALENIFPPVPADVAVALGAFLSQRGVVSAPLMGVLCWLSNSASAVGMYYFARTHKERFRQGLLQKLLPPEAIRSLEEAYGRYGVVGIFVSRFFPAVRAAVTPFAGIVGLSPLRSLVPAVVASGIWYVLLVLAGTTLGREWSRVRRVVETGSGLLAVVGVVATGLVVLWIWRRSRRATS